MKREDWEDLFLALIKSIEKIEEKLSEIEDAINTADNHGILSKICEQLTLKNQGEY